MNICLLSGCYIPLSWTVVFCSGGVGEVGSGSDGLWGHEDATTNEGLGLFNEDAITNEGLALLNEREKKKERKNIFYPTYIFFYQSAKTETTFLLYLDHF